MICPLRMLINSRMMSSTVEALYSSSLSLNIVTVREKVIALSLIPHYLLSPNYLIASAELFPNCKLLWLTGAHPLRHGLVIE